MSKPDTQKQQPLSPVVWSLGVVSFFTDVASEMIYPLLPGLLTTTLHASAAVVGVVEGAAEAMAGLMKWGAGRWADRIGRRRPFLLAGYGIAGTVRPLLGLAGSWPVVLALRLADRLGKGLRSSPRDALIADVTPPEQRGRAFGVQRALDHAGAVAGPLVAAWLMQQQGLAVQAVFRWAVVPAALAMLVLWWGAREPGRRDSPATRPAPTTDPTMAPGWRQLPPTFRRRLLAVALFALANSSDAFLLLRLQEVGIQPAAIALVWACLHVVKTVATALGGRWSDRVGRPGLLLAGWGLYAVVYLGIGFATTPAVAVAWFLIYGLHFGLTEPVEKAWVADQVSAGLRGTAFGAWQATQAMAALPASLLLGMLWRRAGAPVAFGFGAALALMAAVWLALTLRREASELSNA